MGSDEQIVQECNEGARKAERIHEMLVVSNQLDFADVKAISIMSASRWLVKKGEMQRLMWRDIDARLTFGRKIHKQTVYVFLFTDLLVITKKKGYTSAVFSSFSIIYRTQLIQLTGRILTLFWIIALAIWFKWMSTSARKSPSANQDPNWERI